MNASPPPALIIAAGEGSRLRGLSPSKPLLALAGRPLIQHVIENGLRAGVEAFVVTTGHRQELLGPFLEGLSRRLAVPIATVPNPRWRQGNASSVLAARAWLPGPFLLLMADHLTDPGLVAAVAGAPPVAGGLRLGVDRRLDNPTVDLEDVTRVSCEADRIRGIGKGLSPYDAFDTGVFHCTPGLFDALEAATAQGGQGLSDGVRLLAARGRAHCLDIGARFWVDVDSPAMLALAETHLRRHPLPPLEAPAPP